MGGRDIQRKIKSVNSTRQITKALQLVSTAKLKRAKDKADKTRLYFESVLGTVQKIVGSEKSLKHDFLKYRPVQKTLYIVLAADKGLCGGFNINTFKKAMEDIHEPEKAVILAVGRKSKEFFNKMNLSIVKDFQGISEAPTYNDAQSIARIILNLFKTEEVDEIKLVYTELISTISQQPKIIKLLPAEVQQNVSEEGVKADRSVATYEPSPEEFLSYLIPKYIISTLYGALIESAAAFQAAQRIAMENATDNAEEMIEHLTLTFNQARQAAITQEISEIVSGAEALK